MELDLIRKEINNYDNLIKNMLNFRMSLIPIVADIKVKNNLPFYQGKREEEIYKNLETFSNENGIDRDLLTEIYKLIIHNAIEIEENYAENNCSIPNKGIDGIYQEFQKLDNIIEKEIPDIIGKIKKSAEQNNLNLNQIATLYYNEKTKKDEN